MCSISCISARRSSASDHSRASRGRTITGRRDAESHGPGHGFVLEQFDGQGNAARVREASKFGAVPGHGQPGAANHREAPQHGRDGDQEHDRAGDPRDAQPLSQRHARQRAFGGVVTTPAALDACVGATLSLDRLRSAIDVARCDRHVDRHRRNEGDQDRQRRPARRTRWRSRDAAPRRARVLAKAVTARPPSRISVALASSDSSNEFGKQQRRAGQVRDHHFLRFLRTWSISLRSASSSSSLHDSCLRSAAAASLAEPPKNTRINWLTAFFCAVVRDVTGE